ncbi:hypothetical protein CASFOL_008608 [Castilleja foliolosa]|uniref:Cyclin-dependent kinase inhibitor domain-containing protein n=1 Tax=Castilleja foliolosa TaxID=1961234 RepID=A0ABD3DZG2_9LAMI
MGKYIKKPKKTVRDAVKDVSQSFLGVRTRARTLALQRLQSSAADDSPPELEFLELRSRRLVKPPLIRKAFKSSRKPPAPEQGSVSSMEAVLSPQLEISPEKACSEPEALPIKPAGEEDGPVEMVDVGLQIGGEIEASLGENNLDLVAVERDTRESTPTSFIIPADSVPTPGSSTRPRRTSPRAQDVRPVTPATQEIDDFFDRLEEPHRLRFIEKYNFDIVNDVPLPGRYEWVKLSP